MSEAIRAKMFLERYEALCAKYGFLVSCDNCAECCALYSVPKEWREIAAAEQVRVLVAGINGEEDEGEGAFVC